MRMRRFFLAGAAVVMVAACGGGAGDPSSPAPRWGWEIKGEYWAADLFDSRKAAILSAGYIPGSREVWILTQEVGLNQNLNLTVFDTSLTLIRSAVRIDPPEEVSVLGTLGVPKSLVQDGGLVLITYENKLGKKDAQLVSIDSQGGSRTVVGMFRPSVDKDVRTFQRIDGGYLFAGTDYLFPYQWRVWEWRNGRLQETALDGWGAAVWEVFEQGGGGGWKIVAGRDDSLQVKLFTSQGGLEKEYSLRLPGTNLGAGVRSALTDEGLVILAGAGIYFANDKGIQRVNEWESSLLVEGIAPWGESRHVVWGNFYPRRQGLFLTIVGGGKSEDGGLEYTPPVETGRVRAATRAGELLWLVCERRIIRLKRGAASPAKVGGSVTEP